MKEYSEEEVKEALNNSSEEQKKEALRLAFEDTKKAFPKWERQIEKFYALLRKNMSAESSIKSENKGVIDDQ